VPDDSTAPERIGDRVATERKLRGWTQLQLADRAHVSYSLLTKVEAGHAPASPALIGAVARALRVEVTRITGQPYRDPETQVTQLQATIEPLRRALLTWDLPPEDVPPRSLDELAADVKRVSLLGKEARYLQLGLALPTLLDELSVAIHTNEDPRLFALLAEAYGGISGMSHQLGYLDLRSFTLDRIEWAAERSQDPLRVARTKWSRGASLLGIAAYDRGLQLMERTRADLGDNIGTMDGPTLTVYGSLHLRSAVLVSRAGGRTEDADEHLNAAQECVDLLPDDHPNYYGMEFGRANVAIHAVSAAVEAANGAQALERARGIGPLLTETTPVRVGQHWMEVARAWYYQGNRRQAFDALNEARSVTPQLARYHPMVRDLTYSIAAAEARPTEQLRTFMSWLGLKD
jgi:transcriptional regulator with XRE-family HTH domain